MNLTARLATIILVSGVALFVVYRCYKYGSVFGEQQNKREEKTGEEEKTGKGAASASESSRSASNSKMSLKRSESNKLIVLENLNSLIFREGSSSSSSSSSCCSCPQLLNLSNCPVSSS
ncbi:hypothetical protein CRE_05006 [Caenorhabditis remanei]|uniref:Uncharacterized protein n=1 Tax=Caenorhabditis remanei TaxID=31234 RepID=E3MNG0_CAERE|nr:hypothetical protein CRE_05006 [Caenorhabditis remanei]